MYIMIFFPCFSFSHNTSYVELEPLYVVPSANITITFATDQENGVLVYVGNCSF
jgi:slit 2